MSFIIRQRLNKITKPYLVGLLHDATERKTTYRIGQKDERFIESLAEGIKNLGYKAWIYKEGKKRNLWIVEFSKSWLKKTKVKTRKDKIGYISGYFDAEGGIPLSKKVRFYIYFAQKDKGDLQKVKNYLEEFGIMCGKTHNPSKKVDPNYWRFFISSKSYRDFARLIQSFHPRKSYLLRMKR